jgi:hypothetical protein
LQPFCDLHDSTDAKIEALGVRQAERISAYGWQIHGTACSVDALVSAGETGATEDIEAVRPAAGFNEERRD